MDTPYEMRNRQWELHAKMMAIFAPRRNRLKIIVSSIGPDWISGSIWICLIVVLFFSKNMGLRPITVVGPISVAIALQGIAYAIRARTDKVRLYYLRTVEMERKKDRRDLLQKAGLLVLGALFTLLIQLFLKNLK